MSLFGRIRIEYHFRLENQIINFSQIIIQFVCRCIHVICSRKRFIQNNLAVKKTVFWIINRNQNNKGPRIDPRGTAAVIYAQSRAFHLIPYHFVFDTTLF